MDIGDETMTKKPAPVPKGFRTVTPFLNVPSVADAAAFYGAAFDAEILSLSDDVAPDFAEIRIGNSVVLLAAEDLLAGRCAPLRLGGTAVSQHIYIEDVDAAFAQAVAAGAGVLAPLEETFWGDRSGVLIDPFGHVWSMATRVEAVSRGEVAERHAALCAPVPVVETVEEIAEVPAEASNAPDTD
jgi:PhnB protein